MVDFGLRTLKYDISLIKFVENKRTYSVCTHTHTQTKKLPTVLSDFLVSYDVRGFLRPHTPEKDCVWWPNESAPQVFTNDVFGWVHDLYTSTKIISVSNRQ